MTDRIYKPQPGDVVDPYSALAAVDAARPRSGSGPGPSSFFSCPAQVGRDFRRDKRQRPASSDDKWRAIVGTQLHHALEQAFDGIGRQEITCEYRGIVGHTDWLPPAPRDDLVVDWKSTTMKKLGDLQKYGISRAYRAQASFYAVAVKRPNCALVFLPVDGGKDDITIVEFPADRALADAAIDWLQSIRQAAGEGLVPLPDPVWAKAKDPRIHCARFCSHFNPTGDPTGHRRDGCPGLAPTTPPVQAGPFTQV